MKIVVTGASGYIGRRVMLLAKALGHEGVAASRQRTSGTWVPFDLARIEDFVLPADVGAIIHLAARTTRSNDLDEQVELNAAHVLAAKAAASGSRLVFVSSQTARENAPSAYGRIKWQIERVVIGAGGIVVRPGQVYGADEHGLFGTLVALVRRFPILPAFLPAPRIQPIHVDDLALGLLRVACDNQVWPQEMQLGAEQPVTFTHFLQQIGEVRVGRPRLFIPIPVKAFMLCRRLVGDRVWRHLRFDRLISLFALPPMATAADLGRLKLKLRPLTSGMHRSGDGSRRKLLLEGRLLLHYVLKRAPKSGLLRRYLRAVESLSGRQPLTLPCWAMRNPVFIALLDDPRRMVARMPELSVRLDIALVLAEASIEGSERFLSHQRTQNRMGSVIDVGGAVCSEAIWRVLRMLYVLCVAWSERETPL